MVARRDCQKVLLGRPFTGFAAARFARSRSRQSERWAKARAPPALRVSRAECRYADMTLGGHARPPRSRTKIHPTGVRNGIAHGR
jgi:hypothetical protein